MLLRVTLLADVLRPASLRLEMIGIAFLSRWTKHAHASSLLPSQSPERCKTFAVLSPYGLCYTFGNCGMVVGHIYIYIFMYIYNIFNLFSNSC